MADLRLVLVIRLPENPFQAAFTVSITSKKPDAKRPVNGKKQGVYWVLLKAGFGVSGPLMGSCGIRRACSDKVPEVAYKKAVMSLMSSGGSCLPSCACPMISTAFSRLQMLPSWK